MKKITYKDLQLEIEIELSKEIEKSLDSIFKGTEYLNNSHNNEDKHFFELLKYAVEIKDHYAVNSISDRITCNLNLEK